LLGCAALVLLLWWTPLLLPFRLFVTMVHELSHALVAILTGGQVLGIAIRLDGSGVTYARGGNLVLTASAGYVGSSVFGAVLLLVARERHRRLLLRALAEDDLAGISRCLFNSLEAPSIRKFPVLELIRGAMRDSGAAGTLMSGSGATVFGLFPSVKLARTSARKIREQFGPSMWTHVARFAPVRLG